MVPWSGSPLSTEVSIEMYASPSAKGTAMSSSAGFTGAAGGAGQAVRSPAMPSAARDRGPGRSLKGSQTPEARGYHGLGAAIFAAAAGIDDATYGLSFAMNSCVFASLP